MRTYDPDQPLIFIHVPKCGGRSVRELAQGWFGEGCLLHYASGRRGTPPEAHTLEGRSHPVCMYGHFSMLNGHGIAEHYPQVRQFVTILRDPFEQVVSMYYWMRRPGAVWRDPNRVKKRTLHEHIEAAQSPMLAHFPREVTTDNYRDLIEEYFIEIGLLEDLPLSLARIARALGKPQVAPPKERFNGTARDAQYDDLDDLRADFIARHPLEYDVYNHVRARLDVTGTPQDRSVL